MSKENNPEKKLTDAELKKVAGGFYREFEENPPAPVQGTCRFCKKTTTFNRVDGKWVCSECGAEDASTYTWA